MNLNAEQKLAVSHFSGPCIVTATPGSGKTRVLTSRVVYLIKDRGVDPSKILCLTFTNKARRVTGIGEEVDIHLYSYTNAQFFYQFFPQEKVF